MCVLIHTTICASSYYYICAIILPYVCPHTSMCVLILTLVFLLPLRHFIVVHSTRLVYEALHTTRVVYEALHSTKLVYEALHSVCVLILHFIVVHSTRLVSLRHQ